MAFFNFAKSIFTNQRPVTLFALLILWASPPLSAETSSPSGPSFKIDSKNVNRLGFKTYQPILKTRQMAMEKVALDPESGAIIETIFLPMSDMTLEVRYYSLFEYLKVHTAEKESEAFNEITRQYLMQETGLRRAQTGRSGIMPEINLPDFMPKSLASIIGEGTGSLSIHGSSITEFSGTSTFQRPEDLSLFRSQSKFPRLKLDQRQQINIEGVIGSKIHVFVDYNSQNEFQNRNRIEVQYVGEQDEILQSLELGDVNLTLPPGMLVATNIPQGNFGIKGQTRVGALTTTFIASKEEGESSSKDIKIPITGDTEASDSVFMRDVNYSKNRHFFLVDTSQIAASYIRFLDRAGAPMKNENNRPSRIRVFKDDNNGANNTMGENQARPGVMYFDPVNPDLYPEDHEFGFFNEMVQNRDFVLEQCGLVISFVGYVGDNEKVGVMYMESDGDSVGFIRNDTLRLKLIKSATTNADSRYWPLMLRNVYQFGGGGRINPTSLRIDIFTNETPPRFDERDTTFLQIFGMDNDADNLVDRVNIDFDRGLLFFPSLEPFARPYEQNGDRFFLADSNFKMYVEDDPFRLSTLEFQKYNMIVHYTRAEGTGGKTVDLGAMQIIDGSERVYINDRLLTRGADYTIDYQFGQLTLQPSVEIPPNAEVKINFEQVPLFATGTTSLFGFHNEYEFDPQRLNYLTSTLFFQSVESVDRTFVRLGDEPKNSILGEFGGKFEFDSEGLTSLLNRLPLIQSRTASRINLIGGLAFSSPNPNTRGGVLIEDFETAKIEDPRLMMAYQSWRLSSLPKGGGNFDPFKEDAGNLFWFDPYYLSQTRYGFYERDVYGQIEGRFEQHREVPVSVISFVFEPDSIQKEKSWRSVVQPVSQTGVLGMDERDFLQLYVSSGMDQGKVIIDFGQVSEDQVRFNRNHELVGEGLLDTEDKNLDGRLDYNEDTGLDGVPGLDRDSVPFDDGNDDFYRPAENQVPNGRWLNLTEGNNKGQIGSNFDTEDLNGNMALDYTKESFFRVTIDLKNMELVPPPGVPIPEADRKILVERIPYDTTNTGSTPEQKASRERMLGKDDWFLLEIPLPKKGTASWDYYEKINIENMNNVLHVRLTFYDFAKPDTVNFAAINFVGNRFKANSDGITPRKLADFSDTASSGNPSTAPQQPEQVQNQIPGLAADEYHGIFEVVAINTIFNYDYYPPPLIAATLNKYNRSGRVEDFTAQEGSLALSYKDLHPGYEGWALKAENNQQSYLDYASMSFYIKYKPRPGGNYDPKPTFFIRIGIDQNNFYEYSTTPADTNWKEEVVPFQKFLAMKDSLQGNLKLGEIQRFNEDIRIGNFRIKGNPSLTKISIMCVGVANETSDTPITGQVWLDEVRLTDVIREFGMKTRLQVDAQLADVGQVNFTISGQDNKFRNLNDKIPQQSSMNYTLGGTFSLDRLTPPKWGLRLPVSYHKSVTKSLPRFHPGSEDVTIQLPANKERNKTESTSRQFTISYSKTKGTNTLSRFLFDNIRSSFSYANSRSIAPKNLGSNTIMSGMLNYQATLPRDADVGVFPPRVFGIFTKVPLPYFLKSNNLTTSLAQARFRYLPNIFELNTIGNYSKRVSLDQVSGLFRLDSLFETTSGARFQYSPFTSVQSDYNVTVQRNMLETQRGSKLLGMNIGNEINRNQSVGLQVNPKIFSWMQPTYRYQSSYKNDHNPQYAYGIVKGGDFRKFDNSTTKSIGLRFSIPNIRQSISGMRLHAPGSTPPAGEKQQSSSAAYRRQPQQTGPGAGPGAKKSFVSRFLFKPANQFLNSFEPFSFQSMSRSVDRWEKMERNPGFLYQIGLRDVSEYVRERPFLGDTVGPTSANKDFTRTLQGGFRLLNLARLSGTYVNTGSDNMTINTMKYARSKGPQYTVDYNKIYLPWPLNTFISQVDLTSSYELKKAFNGTDIKGVENLSREKQWRPKLRVTANWGRTGTIKTRYTKNESIQRNNLVEQKRRTITLSKDDNININYSFSAPHGISLPFLKGIKLKSNMRTSIDLSRKIDRDLTEKLDDLGAVIEQIINRDVEDISITPTMSYDFAQLIGNLSASYNSHKDRKNGTTRITLMLKVSVQLNW